MKQTKSSLKNHTVITLLACASDTAEHVNYHVLWQENKESPMNQNLDGFNDKDCDVLIRNVGNKYMRVFDKRKYSDDEKRAIYRYLFSRRPKKLPPSLKNRLINLYDPIADRSSRFPDGLRWCINVYVGCQHNCGYCYVNGYSQESVGI